MDKLHYSILKYLKKLSTQKNDSSLMTGCEYLSNFFNLQVNDENDKIYGDHDLTSIFLNAIGEKWSPELEEKFESYKKLLVNRGYFNDVKEGSKEYEERLQKARDRFFEKYSPKKSNNNDDGGNETETQTSTSTTTGQTTDQPQTERPARVFKQNVSDGEKSNAEVLKVKGNEFFKAGDYDKAIISYSEAIEIYSSPIYYCNRGISYNKLSKNSEAVEDFLCCLELDPSHAKAYDKLGLTYMQMGRFEEAINSFQNGINLNPTDQDLLKNLQIHLAEAQERQSGDMGGMGGGVGNDVNFDQMRDMFSNPQFLEQLGPMQEMMNNNPQIMNAAMGLMNDPNFQSMMQNMMNNPELLNMFGGMGGMGGQPPQNR